MFSRKPIEKRKLIYKDFKNLKLSSKNDLIFFSKNKFQSEIRLLVNLFLKENISLFLNKKYNNLNESINDILKLPNVTPGGIIHPRKETGLLYNLITKYLIYALGDSLNYIDGLAFPVIRIKNGIRKKSKRPYETSKLHSDSWVGQYGDAIISFGIEGNFKDNGVNFYIAEKVTDDFFKKINNYDEGLKKFKNLKYLGKLKQGYFYIFDHSILHKTMIKNNSKPRISIDLGIKIKNNIKRNIKYGDKKRWDYINPSFFKNIGSKSLIKINNSIFDIKFDNTKTNQKFEKIT